MIKAPHLNSNHSNASLVGPPSTLSSALYPQQHPAYSNSQQPRGSNYHTYEHHSKGRFDDASPQQVNQPLHRRGKQQAPPPGKREAIPDDLGGEEDDDDDDFDRAGNNYEKMCLD